MTAWSHEFSINQAGQGCRHHLFAIGDFWIGVAILATEGAVLIGVLDEVEEALPEVSLRNEPHQRL